MNLSLVPTRQLFIALVYMIIQLSCTNRPIAQKNHTENNSGLFEFIGRFNKPGMNFSHVVKIWYMDSITIQENTLIETNTDTSDVTTTNFKLMGYKYVDPTRAALYDYRNFSDTAKVTDKGVLMFRVRDPAFAYYANETIRIMSEPDYMSDTIIENVYYRRAKLNLEGAAPNSIQVGYWRCDGKGKLFSFEKKYSDSISCTMTKLMSYKPGNENPYFIQEINFVRDSLTTDEIKVFRAWKENVTNYPINK